MQSITDMRARWRPQRVQMSLVAPLAGLALVGCARPPQGAARSDSAPGGELPVHVTSATADASSGDPGAEGATASDDVAAANTFTLRLYGRVRTRAPAAVNVMLSGTSVRLALGAALVGARGDTAREMATALGLPRDPAAVAARARAERLAWEGARGHAQPLEIVVASRLWVDRAFPLAPSFVSLGEAFGAAPASVDFAHAPNDARVTINGWVAERTAGKINQLLPAGSVDAQTPLVVTDAVYFKGRWADPFDRAATKDEPFSLDTKRTTTVPMMHTTTDAAFAQVKGAKALELRYGDGDLAMLVVAPDAVDGLAALERGLGPETFDAWIASLRPERVAIAMPRFAFRWGGAIEQTLRDLGMRLAFGPRADFSGMLERRRAEGQQLSMGGVFHETWVAVDELGTEASAATGAVTHTTNLVLGPTLEFRADRPFLFVLRDVKRRRILFVGRVASL